MIASSRRQNVDVDCVHCHCTYNMLVDPNDLISWQAGKGYIQDLMPYLSSSERELLISGTCDNCWTNLFGQEEDEDEV